MKSNHHRFAILFSMFSLVFLFFVIWSIKNIVESPRRPNQTALTNLDISKSRKIRKKKDVSEKLKRVKRRKKKIKSLRPILTSSLTGQNFGLNLHDGLDADLDSDLLDDNYDIVMDETSVDERPTIISRVPIEFPRKAIRDEIDKGVVVLRMLVDNTGSISNSEIISSEPKGYFEEAALSMVQAWKFRPARYKDRPVSIWVKQVVKFGE